jgi:superfamily II DNA/RNA helicase
MLDMGFGIQIDQILKFVPKQKQTLMFSATLPANIINMSRKYMKQPVRISIGESNEVADNIKQENIKTNDAKKYGELMYQLKNREGSVLIFVKTKYSAERLAKKLTSESQISSAIHGDLRQSARERVIADFRKKKNRILVATDIAARGLDIPHIEHVINYDLPQCPEDYIHRIGRTARAGMSGCAINLITEKDASKWKEIYKIMHPSARDKAALGMGDYPTDAKPIPTLGNTAKKKNDAYSATKAGKKPKAKMTNQNPFNPFEPVKKKFRSKFNKNSKNYAEMLSQPITFKAKDKRKKR